MSRVEAAAAADRLPWLPDEPSVQPAPGKTRGRIGAALAAFLLVAAIAFRFGARTGEQPASKPSRTRAVTTVRLPAPRAAFPAQREVPIAAQPQLAPEPQPEVRPAPVREVRIYIPVEHHAARAAASAGTAPPTANKASAMPPAEAVTARPFVLARPWNPRVIQGAAGRLVQIGAFGSVHQSKEGWRYMVRAYPAVAHLPAVVRPSLNSKGHAFYRFQVGTTSQAHSEVLCQRMAAIHLSCAVVGLPWKAKVER